MSLAGSASGVLLERRWEVVPANALQPAHCPNAAWINHMLPYAALATTFCKRLAKSR
jgi:hypothetical protein